MHKLIPEKDSTYLRVYEESIIYAQKLQDESMIIKRPDEYTNKLANNKK